MRAIDKFEAGFGEHNYEWTRGYQVISVTPHETDRLRLTAWVLVDRMQNEKVKVRVQTYGKDQVVFKYGQRHVASVHMSPDYHWHVFVEDME